MTALAHRNNIVCPPPPPPPLFAPSPENDLTPRVQIKHGKGQHRIGSKVLLGYLISKEAFRTAAQVELDRSKYCRIDIQHYVQVGYF